uniref:Methyltransferase-like protein 17, mitochondrial n=1 Tax=Meloidogyne javanica TaxID=6303 RepID=A0A915MW59_MELJA
AKEGDSKKLIVRGYKSCKFHANILDKVEEEESANGCIKFECPGGGRISHEPEKKHINVYGYSQKMVRRFISRQLIKQLSVPNKNILPLPTTSMNEREEENNLVILKKKRRRQQDPLFNRTFANRCAHLTTINNSTETVGIAKLTLPPKAIVNPRVTKLSKLPLDAVEALGGILLDSRVPPKQLQREADVLSNQLDQRHFPASIVEFRQTRREILDEIFEENPAFCYDYNIYQNRPFIETQLAKLVQKRLAVRRYNWKPLKFKDLRQATVYCLSRFGGHFAEMKRVLAEFDRNGFVPEKILDFGSGIGSSFWAAYERWGDNVQEYSLIDSDLSMRHFSIDLSRGPNYSTNGELVSKNLFFRKELFPSPKHTYDLVILHRTLIEMPSQEARKELIEKLWKRTKKYLVIVESSMPDAFKSLIKIRDFILTAGYDFDLEKTKELLYEYKAIDQDTIEMLSDKNLQTYEKYCRARELLERGHRCVNCHVCTAADGLQRFIVALLISADDTKERINGGKEQLKQVASAE